MDIYVAETELKTHAFVLKTDNRTSKKGQHMCPLEASTYELSTHRIGPSNIMSLLLFTIILQFLYGWVYMKFCF